MGETEVNRWRRYGKDRLYVNADGVRLGWHDLVSGETVVEVNDRAGEVHAAIDDWKRAQDRQADAEASAAEPETPPREAPVRVPEGAPSSASELPTPKETPEHPSGEAQIDATHEPDLAATRPGAMAREQAVALREAAPVRTFLARLVGAKTEERAWRIGADGEERVAARLAALQRKDPRWHAIHSIPLAQDVDIDHLVIGPGGVFTLNTKHHPGARVWVARDTLMVNGARQPYVHKSRHEARRTAALLGSATLREVFVTGVIVLVGAEDLTIKEPASGVEVVYRGRLVRWLRRQPETLDEAAIETIFEAARRPSTWRADPAPRTFSAG